MRCFIAIDIDKNLRTQIERLQQDLRQKTGLAKPDVKWVDPNLIHLTLKFLGEIKDKDLAGICQIVSNAAAGHKSFSIDVEKLGSFGSPAKVVWVGITANEDLVKLQKDLQERLQVAGRPKESRKFSGHLTLCRIKKPRPGRIMQEVIKDYDGLKLGSVLIDSVCIYKSDLTKSGPVYTLISKSSLQQ